MTQETREMAFIWKQQPEAAAFIESIVDRCCRSHEEIMTFAFALKTQTSTRLFDWVDHVIVPYSDSIESELEGLGFIGELSGGHYRLFEHPGAQLPSVVLQELNSDEYGLAIKVESLNQFLMVRGRGGNIEGSPLSPLRCTNLPSDNGIIFNAVERRASRGIEPTTYDDNYLHQYIHAQELWSTRPRQSEDEESLYFRTLAIAEQMVQLVGQNLAAWIVLEVERDYWQSRNMAGQLQKARQDRLGLGWANHDHHTFRSSRRYFQRLVRLFEILGFHCRERFYAGTEAGWGAQIMENHTCGLVLFLDVDLSPDEVSVDFSHHSLPERDELGTIGLWCALHGDSILKAGMHHLEAQFEFDLLQEDLRNKGIQMMQPFSNFSYLKQAFTVGEIWPVEEETVQSLLERNLIDSKQAERFIKEGAVGSHLENLQRREGYKGFNQKNVSLIIKKTDPRIYLEGS